MREPVGRLLSAAEGVHDVARVVADAAARAVGFGSFSFVAFEPGPLGSGDVFVRSSEFPVDTLRQVFVEATFVMEREMGGFAARVTACDGSFDPLALIPALERTPVFQRCWRPYRMERQILSPMKAGADLLGFFCLTRSARERAFSRADLRAVEALRSRTQRTLAARRLAGSGDLALTLRALAAALPTPAFLFDGDGRLRWMSAEGELRLGVHALCVGASTVVRGNALLEELRHAARASDEALGLVERAMLRTGSLREGEALAIRRLEERGRAYALVLVRPAPAPDGGADGEAAARAAGLSAVEARVASLAAEGYTVLNMALTLGIAETTVRTHLRRGYAKLGVHGRAELATRLLRPRRR